MSDVFLLAVSSYLLQAAGNLLIAGLLLWLHRSYPRRYLADWGYSWLALGAYHALAGWAFYLAPLRPATDPLRTGLSSASLVFAVLQLAWLVRGTRDMLTGRQVAWRRFAVTVAMLSLAAAAVGVVSAAADSDLRLFIRVGVRSLAAAGILAAAAYAVWRRTRRDPGVGPRLLAGAFLLYGVDQLHYFVILFVNLFGTRLVSPFPLTAMLDFFLQLGVGIGMTAWLLESERREVARASREIEVGRQRLQLVLHQLPLVAWSVDEELRVISALGSGLQALGARPIERAGRRVDEYLPGETGSAVVAAHRRALEGESVGFDARWAEREFRVRIDPLRESDGTIIGCVGVALDITEERRREVAWAETQRLESLGVLAGGIAHDLGNLLGGVLGHAEIAAQRLPADTPARRHLDRAIDGASRGGDLVRQLLTYAGRGEARRQRLDVSDLLRSMGDLLSIALSPGCNLVYELDEDGLEVSADAAQLRQVALNLITNAAEALGEEPGTVTVSAQWRELTPEELTGFRFGAELAAGRYVAIRVADTGVGMEETTLSRIFEPFFSTHGAGRGLGLASVLGIVRGHGGALRVDSAPGRGTTIEVVLPESAEAAEPEAAEESA